MRVLKLFSGLVLGVMSSTDSCVNLFTFVYSGVQEKFSVSETIAVNLTSRMMVSFFFSA